MVTTPNRPPSCDKLKPTLKPCPACGCINIKHSRYAECTRLGCVLVGPDKDPHGHKWNSIPRRSEVLELISLVELAYRQRDFTSGSEWLEEAEKQADKLRKEIGE